MKKTFLNTLVGSLTLLSAILITAIPLTNCHQDRLPGWLTLTEDSLTIPTYLVDPPNPMPRFYEGRAHQGVQRRMYPYPMNDQMTEVKEDRKYHIIYLENEFIKIGIMPSLGGRIYEAYDKSNGYKFFYRNDVIEPSLIGMIGFWISGGNAWGFPHHHGPNTVEPMDYIIRENPDGSATVWMAYTENLHRMRICFGFTVYPNSSIVELTARPYNPTPYVHSFLYWVNPAVHADTNYQVIFPPSVEYATQHHKREMITWPIGDRIYNNFDYTGLDISMWKNTGVPSSFFSWDPQEDFFGGYDHGRQAGTAWVGNHYICTGMKYWADGNNARGRQINEGLTDTSGRYIELMAGAYTDNQPDYSWLQPFESKDVTMTWFPIRLLGGLVQANRNAALNLVVENGEVSVRLNTTSVFKNARAVLTCAGEEVFSETIDIGPATPYTSDIAIDGPAEEEILNFTLYSLKGETILEYRPQAPPGKPMPVPLGPPDDPQDVKTVEELYLNGLRLDQFHNASISSYPYYFEALKRDPGDYRVNTQLGILCLERKMFEQAEEYLQTAADRITMRYTRPKDSDALYYLGIAQRRLHKNREAYDNFYDATWNAGWHTPAYHQLAEIDCENGDYITALEHIDRALSTNINNLKALDLKVVIMRRLGMLEEAQELAEQVIEKDLLDHQSRNELYLILKELNRNRQAEAALDELDRIMQDRVQSYLECATAYSNCGFYGEAIDVLSRLEEKGNQFPMLYYYMGYYWSKLNETEKAGRYFAAAPMKPHRYCFPFRDESVEVLSEAISYNPDDAMAPYYLGNLYYELQPEKAIGLWERSQAIDDGFYIVQRNLALAAREQQGDLDRAVKLYGEAFARNSEDQRLMYEYDLVLEQAGIQPKERYDMVFRDNRRIAEQRSNTFLRELELLTFLGQYDEVIDILNTAEFIESEGSRTLRDIFLDVHILRSLQEYGAGNYEAAAADMQEALDYPIGRWGSERRAQMNYLLGTFYEKTDDHAAAEECYKKAVSEPVEGTEYHYEKGLAFRKLGQSEQARKEFNALIELVNSRGGADVFRSFEAASTGGARQAHNYYLRGLAYLGTGRKSEARLQFARALELDPAHLWASCRLDE